MWKKNTSTSEKTMHPARFASNEVRRVKSLRRTHIMVANAKGGCGKTTLATNLASHFAHQGNNTALIDCDPQYSSLDWLAVRAESLPKIHGIPAVDKSSMMSRNLSWRMRVPPACNKIIIDTPAGFSGNELEDLVQQADIIIMPMIPSAIDIRAATAFIAEIMNSRAYKKNPKPIAVIANRVKKNTLIYNKLESFLNSLNTPFITALRDTQFYVRASEYGMGLADFAKLSLKDKREWQPLLDWIEQTTSSIHSQTESQEEKHNPI